MGQLTFNIKYKKPGELILSPSELQDLYFYGIKICSEDGTSLKEETITQFIAAAQKEIENFLDIKLTKQVIDEQRDFVVEDFYKWSYVPTSYPVVYPCLLEGSYGTQNQISYPSEWLSTKKSNQEKYWRRLHLVPNSGGTVTINGPIFTGSAPYIGLSGAERIPNYWRCVYVTGFDYVPKDLLDIVGKLAAVNLFHIAGDLILGAGIASQSLSLDGLSQSISSTASATSAGYGARILGYLKDIEEKLPRIRSYYKGIKMTSL
jgi:hypothetical protein